MSQARHGFSLIELLVVVAVVAILAALLMPAIATVKEMANRLNCAGRMRQVAMGFTVYRSDYHGQFPTIYDTVSNWSYGWNSWDYRPYEGRWQHRLAEYLDSYEVFNCPVAKRAYPVAASQDAPIGGYRRGSAIGGGPGGWCTCLIAYNSQCWGRGANWSTPGPMNDAKVEAYLGTGRTRDRCPVLFDGLWQNDGNRMESTLDYWHYLYWIHRGRSNMVFEDGHLEVHAITDVTSFYPLQVRE